DGGQGADRFQCLGVGGPVGLVAGIGLFALRGAVLAVEHDDDLGPAGEFLVDALAQQGEEHELGRQLPLVVLVAGPDLGWGAETYLASSPECFPALPVCSSRRWEGLSAVVGLQQHCWVSLGRRVTTVPGVR